jgi:hypothetical protein
LVVKSLHLLVHFDEEPVSESLKRNDKTGYRLQSGRWPDGGIGTNEPLCGSTAACFLFYARSLDRPGSRGPFFIRRRTSAHKWFARHYSGKPWV